MDTIAEQYFRTTNPGERRSLLEANYRFQFQALTNHPSELLEFHLNHLLSYSFTLMMFLELQSEKQMSVEQIVKIDLFLCMEISAEHIFRLLEDNRGLYLEHESTLEIIFSLLKSMKHPSNASHEPGPPLFFVAAGSQMLLSKINGKVLEFDERLAQFARWCNNLSYTIFRRDQSIDDNLKNLLLNYQVPGSVWR